MIVSVDKEFIHLWDVSEAFIFIWSATVWTTWNRNQPRKESKVNSIKENNILYQMIFIWSDTKRCRWITKNLKCILHEKTIKIGAKEKNFARGNSFLFALTAKRRLPLTLTGNKVRWSDNKNYPRFLSCRQHFWWNKFCKRDIGCNIWHARFCVLNNFR